MKCLLIGAFTLALSSSTFAQKPNPQPTVTAPRSPTFPTPVGQKADAGVEQLLKDYEAAFNRRDARALTDLYTENAIRLGGPPYRVLHGRAAIEDFYRQMVAGAGPTLVIRQGRTQMITADVAVTEGTYEVADGGRGVYVLTAVRQSGQWKLASVVPVADTSR